MIGRNISKTSQWQRKGITSDVMAKMNRNQTVN